MHINPISLPALASTLLLLQATSIYALPAENTAVTDATTNANLGIQDATADAVAEADRWGWGGRRWGWGGRHWGWGGRRWGWGWGGGPGWGWGGRRWGWGGGWWNGQADAVEADAPIPHEDVYINAAAPLALENASVDEARLHRHLRDEELRESRFDRHGRRPIFIRPSRTSINQERQSTSSSSSSSSSREIRFGRGRRLFRRDNKASMDEADNVEADYRRGGRYRGGYEGGRYRYRMKRRDNEALTDTANNAEIDEAKKKKHSKKNQALERRNNEEGDEGTEGAKVDRYHSDDGDEYHEHHHGHHHHHHHPHHDPDHDQGRYGNAAMDATSFTGSLEEGNLAITTTPRTIFHQVPTVEPTTAVLPIRMRPSLERRDAEADRTIVGGCKPTLIRGSLVALCGFTEVDEPETQLRPAAKTEES
ncbi:MAG: hypothetical protein DHS80DRAFT_24803 [Piptocephalis tieghemiana]|nr:MAG: hypothetical protein DHS80DRAFT_24803 [Piptocephalis tieghemiana]